MPDLAPTDLVTEVQRAALPRRTAPLEFIVLAASAVAVAIAAYLHGRLFHQGYGQVDVVGPLFLLNVIGSGVFIALLLLRRVIAYLVGALAVSVGSLVSILISHSSSFFGFAEQSYDGRATAIVIAEAASVVLITVALLISVVNRRRGHLLSPERIDA